MGSRSQVDIQRTPDEELSPEGISEKVSYLDGPGYNAGKTEDKTVMRITIAALLVLSEPLWVRPRSSQRTTRHAIPRSEIAHNANASLHESLPVVPSFRYHDAGWNYCVAPPMSARFPDSNVPEANRCPRIPERTC